MNDRKSLERKSSAVTLSDMEVFIFPELMYSLVLANIMSPRIWQWREDPWFSGIEGMKPYRRILRLKQFIMDHYFFNLDLETWGLTTKERELARFEGFISRETLEQSNALFGYEGDSYYFDIDIRSHFGLDRYEGNVIPYWKTETVEAMDAFAYKPGYATGAGECVSLAALYAAALFIVARIPLKDIYLMATPLHSQNFIDLDEGILTNNRRLVTKNMWFNGTALSAQARRALENEKVTILAHQTGFIHRVYDRASVDPGIYAHFSERLNRYLNVEITTGIVGNFLRHDRDCQKCFQMKWPLQGVDRYIAVERVFAYEHGSPYRMNDATREKLMSEIEEEEFQPTPLPGRIDLTRLEDFVTNHPIDPRRPGGFAPLKDLFPADCVDSDKAIEGLTAFVSTLPRLPDHRTKEFVPYPEPLGIHLDMGREEIIGRLGAIRGTNEMADMAFYAFRDLNRTDHRPFLLAAIERNPVSIEALHSKPIADVFGMLQALPDASIYDGPGRLAQPDEVWNFGRGDGFEKALLLANILHHRFREKAMTLQPLKDDVLLEIDDQTYRFKSRKNLEGHPWEIPLASA